MESKHKDFNEYSMKIMYNKGFIKYCWIQVIVGKFSFFSLSNHLKLNLVLTFNNDEPSLFFFEGFTDRAITLSFT